MHRLDHIHPTAKAMNLAMRIIEPNFRISKARPFDIDRLPGVTDVQESLSRRRLENAVNRIK